MKKSLLSGALALLAFGAQAQMLRTAQVPAAVRALLARDFKMYKVTEAATIISAAGVTTHKAELSKGGKKHDVLFNADDFLIKK